MLSYSNLVFVLNNNFFQENSSFAKKKFATIKDECEYGVNPPKNMFFSVLLFFCSYSCVIWQNLSLHID